MPLYTFIDGQVLTAGQLNDSFLSRVGNTGNETVAGDKTFTGATTLSGGVNLVNATSVALKDSITTVQSVGDATAKFKFDAGSIGTGQTRIIVVPDTNLTLVGEANTQTISGNKTFTGTVNATGATITVPTATYPDSTTKPASTAFVSTNFTNLADTQTVTGDKTFSGTTSFTGATVFSGSIGGQFGYSRVIGLRGDPGGTPDDEYDLSADAVVLFKSSDGSQKVAVNTGTLTNDITTTGAGGREGSSFTSTWVHFYFIWNGTTLETLSSATAPPTGPTLPSGYTHWAYAGAVRADGSGDLLPTYGRGNDFFYQERIQIITAASGTEASVGLGNEIPPNSKYFKTNAILYINYGANGPTGSAETFFRLVTGVNYFSLETAQGDGETSDQGKISAEITFPNVANTLYHITNTSVVSADLDVYVTGYSVPNGD